MSFFGSVLPMTVRYLNRPIVAWTCSYLGGAIGSSNRTRLRKNPSQSKGRGAEPEAGPQTKLPRKMAAEALNGGEAPVYDSDRR